MKQEVYRALLLDMQAMFQDYFPICHCSVRWHTDMKLHCELIRFDLEHPDRRHCYHLMVLTQREMAVRSKDFAQLLAEKFSEAMDKIRQSL